MASTIAIATALEAWSRLQHPGEGDSVFSSLTSEAILAIALPLIAVAVVVGLRWGARSLSSQRPPGGESTPRPAALHSSE